MRLYIKLTALILATASLQQLVFAGTPSSELWFGLRCSFAYTIDDKEMISRLADEAREIYIQHPPIRVHAGGGG